MNEQQITDRLVAAQTAFVGKLGAQPKIEPTISFNGSGKLSILIYGPHSYENIGYVFADTFDGVLGAFDAFIAALPDLATAKFHNHMRRVADCIDKGREDGIDDAYITPLVAVKSAMAENLLAKPVAL